MFLKYIYVALIQMLVFEQNYDVYVLKDCCMSHTGKETHNLYITNLARLVGKDKII